MPQTRRPPLEPELVTPNDSNEQPLQAAAEVPAPSLSLFGDDGTPVLPNPDPNDPPPQPLPEPA